MLVPKPQKKSKPRRQATVDGKSVTIGELREFVLSRDRGCIIRQKLPQYHECRGPRTLEHVTGVHGPTDPRRDDERHCVEACLGINGISIASGVMRVAMRDHLRGLYPECEHG